MADRPLTQVEIVELALRKEARHGSYGGPQSERRRLLRNLADRLKEHSDWRYLNTLSTLEAYRNG